jgi:superfamily II DNA or RNA helicase
VLPTAGGKTICFSYITHHSAAKGKRILILTHRGEILDQISLALKREGCDHGIVKAGEEEDYTKAVQVGSVQTVLNRMDLIAVADLIICDEFHHFVSESFKEVLDKWPKAHILGVTATPQRLDGKGLKSIADTMVEGATAAWLIENGFLAKPQYWAPPGPDMDGVKMIAGDFDQGEIERRMDQRVITGNAIAEYRKHSNGLQAIAFCCSVKHAQDVAEAFTAAGYASECIHGGTPDRKEMMERFRAATTKVLTNCDLIGEGVDVPAVCAAILLRPTASLGLHLQQIGRVLRPKPDGSPAVIIDHAGNLMRHGGVEQEREWTLEDKERKPKGAGPSLTQCTQCYFVWIPNGNPKCPNCGYAPPVKERDIKLVAGSLAEWKPVETEGQKREAARMAEIKACKTREELVAFAKAHGYKDKWVDTEWGFRTGKLPPWVKRKH